ncbi:GAF and ANTAR domain-containing protein [Nocardioides nanhaiensis]|uniref:GAF and ANTAR domain-containing protein n=1 Tax=Nocardioides nanhaiensis TaxID=1476871 RepID=A0ABP8VUC1_9ACTN
MNTTREREVIRAFVDLSHELTDDYDAVEMLTALTGHCADLLDVAAAGLLLADATGTLHLAAASSEGTGHLETFQLQRNQGPCLDCYRDNAAVTVPDLAAQTDRWPIFNRAALTAGFRSVHALPMRLGGRSIGTLGLFGASTGLLGPDDLELAQALAHVASVAILNARSAGDRAAVATQLQSALTSRIVLEQAKGVLAHTGDLEMGHSFEALRRYARDHGLKLSEVAEALVERRLPGELVLGHARTVGLLPHD